MKFIIFVLLVLSVFPFISALETDASLEINQDRFIPGDRLIANLIITNNFDSPQAVVLEVLLKSEDNFYNNLLPPIYEELNAAEKKTVNLYNLSVDDSFNEGNYILMVRIIAQGDVLTNLNKSFIIADTLKSFNFVSILCKDKSCSEPAKVFSQGESIFIDYTSDVSNLTIDSILLYPDGTKKRIAIPASIRAEQTGTYKLEVSASRENYKTQLQNIQFGVISQPSNFSNNHELAAENKTAPADSKKGNFAVICDLFSFLIAIIILALVFVLIKRLSR